MCNAVALETHVQCEAFWQKVRKRDECYQMHFRQVLRQSHMCLPQFRPGVNQAVLKISGTKILICSLKTFPAGSERTSNYLMEVSMPKRMGFLKLSLFHGHSSFFKVWTTKFKWGFCCPYTKVTEICQLGMFLPCTRYLSFILQQKTESHYDQDFCATLPGVTSSSAIDAIFSTPAITYQSQVPWHCSHSFLSPIYPILFTSSTFPFHQHSSHSLPVSIRYFR